MFNIDEIEEIDTEAILYMARNELLEMFNPTFRKILFEEGKKVGLLVDDDYISKSCEVQLRELLLFIDNYRKELVEEIADEKLSGDSIGKKCPGMKIATDLENAKRQERLDRLDELNKLEDKIVKEVQMALKTRIVGRSQAPIIERKLLNSPLHQSGDFNIRPYMHLESEVPLTQISRKLSKKKEILIEEFKWFENIIDNLFQQLQARSNISSERYFKIRPLLIVGGPGCGKSTFAKRFCEEMGVVFNFVMAGGSSDSAILKGVTRGWGTARPSLPVETIAVNRIGNPVFIVDETDKTSRSDRNGSILDVLLQQIEPSTASNFFDDCLMAKVDLSYCNWIATANSLNNIPLPLLDRFDIVYAPNPSPENAINIALSCLKNVARRYGCDQKMLPNLNELEIETDLISRLTPRQINKLVEQKTERYLVKTPKYYN